MIVWRYNTPGIPDSCFIRGEVPMTKEEIRTIVISKLRLESDSTVYDIGAGTGSLTIEAANLVNRGVVYAVEKDRKGIELIKKNSQKFGMNNVNIVKGEAPGILNGFPLADRIIVGGSGGKLDEILRKGKKKLKKQGRIVITAVTIDTLSQAKKSLERLNLTFNICNIAVTRAKKVADYQMLKGMNPVFIISAVKEDINDR